jgi:hypothetical protein
LATTLTLLNAMAAAWKSGSVHFELLFVTVFAAMKGSSALP